MEDVDRLERRGDIKGAISLCSDGLVRTTDPEVRALLHLRIGRCLLETELDEAADRLGQARREAEQIGDEVLLGRIDLLDARLASLRGRHRTASERLASADQRLASSPDDRIELELLHAGAERQRGELTKALARLQALSPAELDSRPLLRAEFLDEIGATHLASGDFNAAVETLTDAVALDHRLNVSDYASARSRLLLAAALLGRGDRRRSRQLIEEVRDSFGGSTAGMSDVFALRGQWYEEGNEFSLAARDYRTGLDIDRDSDDEIGQIRALRRIARVRRKQGNISAAEESLEEAWNLARGNEDDVIKSDLYMEEGELALDGGDYDRAIERFGRALVIATDDDDERAVAIAKRRLATARWENGDLTEAEALLRDAREVLEQRGDLRELNDLLDDLGEVLIEGDAYKDAIDVLNESLEIDERLGTISSRARSLALLSRAHLKQGDRVRAGEYIRKASEVYADSEDEVGRSDVLYDLGLWLHQEGRLREARTTFQHAFRLDSRHDDRIGVVRALRGLGAVYRTMGDLVRSRESLEEASEFLKNKEDRAERAHLDLEFGRLLAAEGKTGDAERTLIQARERFESIKSPVDAATCNRLLGRLHGVEGGSARFRVALELMESAKVVFLEYNDGPELDELYDDLGRIYLKMGRYSEAQQAVEASMKLGVRDRWRGGQGSSLLLLGRIDVAKDDRAEAKRNFESALRLFEEVEDEAGASTARLELGDLAAHEGDYDEALSHFRAARQIDQAQRDFRGLCLVFRKLGDVYFNRGEYERAEEAYDQADENLRWFSDKREEASLFHSRGILAAQRGDHSQAVSMFKKALTRFREVEDADKSIETYRRLATSYHALERFDEAIECLREMGLEQASIWHSLLRTFDADIADASVDRFLNQDFNAATQEAFKVLEQKFRSHDELDDGHRAVGAVIRDWATPERRGLAPFETKDELTNFANFSVGAFSVIRNRVVHGRVQLSSTDAMAALGVAHLISALVEAPASLD